MATINQKALEAAKGKKEEEKINPMTLNQQAYEKYLSTPTDTSSLNTPENVINKGVSDVSEGYKSGGFKGVLLPALSSVLNLANTSLGSKLMGAVSGGDVYQKGAYLGQAGHLEHKEQMDRAAAAQAESERMKAVSEAGLEGVKANVKSFEDTKKTLADGLIKYGDLAGAQAVMQLKDENELNDYSLKNPEKQGLMATILNSLTGINLGGGQELLKKKSIPVGTIDNGYKFKGGDPSKPENWEPAQ